MIEDNKNLNLNKNLYLASPRGFCAGVERAIKIVEQAIKEVSIWFSSFVMTILSRSKVI